ncbi:MAG TPA: Na-translocating system protein MpsC family protein [Solirubrobacteraceae bacterium]|jgi:uncharacterized protein YbcI
MAIAQPPAHDEELARHSVLREISQAMVRVYKAQFGRGPKKTCAYWAGPDVLVVTLEQTLTAAEHRMEALGEHERLRNLRTLMQQADITEFCDPVEAITGRKIRAFLSSIDTTADVATETFVLHTAGYDGPSRSQLNR